MDRRVSVVFRLNAAKQVVIAAVYGTSRRAGDGPESSWCFGNGDQSVVHSEAGPPDILRGSAKIAAPTPPFIEVMLAEGPCLRI